MADSNISNYYNNRYNTYVGARYVPIFDGEWDNTKTYEPLTVVTNSGNSYISKTNVPTGADIENETYWVLFSNYNAQLAEIMTNINSITSEINNINDDIDELKESIEYTPLRPTLTERTNYKNYAALCMISYMAQNSLSDCVVGTPTISGAPIMYVYASNKGYLGLFGQGKYVTDETTMVGDVTYKNLYSDCATMVGMITKGMTYQTSPYYLSFNGTPTEDELHIAAQENPDRNKPFTFDFFNNFDSDQMGYIMNKSGNTLNLLSNHNAGVKPVIYDNNINQLQTGDLVFITRQSSYDNNYNGIFHCGIYVKDLNDLNVLAATYNFSVQAILDSADDTQYGYIFEMSNSMDDTDYNNCLRIVTMYHYMNNYLGSEQWVNVYGCQANSNFMNSNKAREMGTGARELINSVEYGTILDRRTAVTMNMLHGGIETYDLKLGGREMPANTDLNTLGNGFWRITTTSVLPTITNKPPSIGNKEFFKIWGVGFNQSTTYGNILGIQICFAIGSASVAPRLMFRTQTGAGVWTPWQLITSAADS